jgi:hypothetical protein
MVEAGSLLNKTILQIRRCFADLKDNLDKLYDEI